MFLASELDRGKRLKFSRKQFWDGFRDRIDSSIEQEQVDGLEFLLDRMEQDPFWKDLRHIAYALATVGHETAWSFQPVEEGYYLGSVTRVKNFQKTLRYYPYFGRGYVQLTWEKNYEKAGDAFDVDLVNDPELALEDEISYKTLTYGMHQGWFTGFKLTDYILGFKCDYKGARKIINGTDKAALIAGYAVQFERVLQAALEAEEPLADITDTEIETAVEAIQEVKPELPVEVPVEQTQNAETIINNETPAAPAFVPENLVMEAPAKDGATASVTKNTILGVTVPAGLYMAFEGLKQWVQDGVIDVKQVLDMLLGLIRDNIRYIPYLVGFIVSVVVVKKVFKQITFLVQMFINASPTMHNIKIVPFVAEEPYKRWYQFWK